MGLYPSKTELFLPSETLIRCTPDRCWCKGHHHNNNARYMYVERGGDGRERYHDGFDMMNQLMGNGGGGGGGMWPAWKDPSQWNIRDMERFTDFFGEWQAREMGRKQKHSGMGYGPGGGGMWGVGRGEFERMQSEMEERFKRMAEGNEERDAFLFGNERERRKEMFQGNVLRMIQELWPQLASMAAGTGGMGFPPMGMMGGGPGMMPQGPGGGGGFPMQMQMPPGAMYPNMMQPNGPFNNLNGFNGMPPGMGQMPHQMPPNMMDPNGFGRPYRRRRAFADDEFDEPVGLANPYANIHGPGRFGRRRFGDEGDFGGLGGASPMPRPRGPSGSGPHRPGGLDGGGLVYDEPIDLDYDVPACRPRDPLRTRRTYAERPDILRSDPIVPVSPLVATPVAEPVIPATSPVVDPVGGIRVSQTTATTNTFQGAAAAATGPSAAPTGIVVEETIADPEIGPSMRHTPTARVFGVHIRATPIDRMRPGHVNRPPPYPADTSLSGLDTRENRARREVRFADEERSARARLHGRMRADDDIGDATTRGDI